MASVAKAYVVHLSHALSSEGLGIMERQGFQSQTQWTTTIKSCVFRYHKPVLMPCTRPVKTQPRRNLSIQGGDNHDHPYLT